MHRDLKSKVVKDEKNLVKFCKCLRPLNVALGYIFMFEIKNINCILYIRVFNVEFDKQAGMLYQF